MKTKILSDEEQQLTLKVYNQVYGGFGYSSICQVYSKWEITIMVVPV